jgi:putative MATE family efflux protein
VAAVGLANQIFFLFNLMTFGIVSGCAIYTAQYWGNRDLAGIRKVVVLCLGMSLTAAALFTTVALVFPRAAMSLYTTDPAVIELGVQYLRIIGFSYIATAISFTLANQLRSTGDVRTPMLISMVALSLGTVLNYLLIFGGLGLPAMGVRGAALGTCLARIGECAAMVFITYRDKKPTAVYLADLRGISARYMRAFMLTVLPVAANETVWSLGVTIYNIIYAHIGTQAIAAINITSTIEGLAFVIFNGISNGTAIMIGNRIGAGETDTAYRYARYSLIMGILLGVITGGGMIALAAPIVSLYKISDAAAFDARSILTVLGCFTWVRVSNQTIIVGILRSGGDTRYSLVLDVGTVWFVGIPMALLGAFVLHLPIYWVVAMVMSDDLTKAGVGFYRYRTRKWINNLTEIAA